MRVVSIDTETLGLDPEKHDMIEFGAVDCDFATQLWTPLEDLPTFRALFKRDSYRGSAYAMAMNAGVIQEIAEKTQKKGETAPGVYYPHEFPAAFAAWLESIGYAADGEKLHIVPAGKNFSSFDLRFLKIQTPKLFDLVSVSHRVVDPAVLYCDFLRDDRVPDLNTCLERSRVVKEVAHTAVADALDVIAVLRHHVKTRPYAIAITETAEADDHDTTHGAGR